jgi:hypothetical protein
VADFRGCSAAIGRSLMCRLPARRPRLS